MTNQVLAKRSSTETPVYISIHVRRTDYGIYLDHFFKKEYVEDDYFTRAIQYYRDLYDVRKLRYAVSLIYRGD